MPSRPRIIPQQPPIFPPLPDWARKAGALEGLQDAAFCAGAALAAISPVAKSEHPLTKLWRQRLALACAAAIVRLQGRSEDEAMLRSHLCLTRPGDDPGPAAKLLLAWRALAAGSVLGPSALNVDWPVTLGNLMALTVDEAAQEAIDAALAARIGRKSPIEAAASVAATSLRLRPDSRPLALWLADAVLARHLGWPAPVPLLAAQLKRVSLPLAAGPQADLLEWQTACAQAYGRAAAMAFDLYADLARRAERLLTIAPKLRGRDADATILALLSEDALMAHAGARASDRSSRRLFERLVTLGVVRELTGRPTFRLYGL